MRHFTETNPLLLLLHGHAPADGGGGALATAPAALLEGGGGGAAGEASPDLGAWDAKLKLLEMAIQEAKDATVGVAKVRRRGKRRMGVGWRRGGVAGAILLLQFSTSPARLEIWLWLADPPCLSLG